MGQTTTKEKDGFDVWLEKHQKKQAVQAREPTIVDGQVVYPKLYQRNGPINAILFGTGDSGKTTVLKQLLSFATIKVGTAIPYQQQHDLIRSNIITGLTDIAQLANQDNMNEMIRDAVQTLLKERENDTLILQQNQLAIYKLIWDDPAIQAVWKNRSTLPDGYYLMDYWMSRIDDIVNVEKYNNNVPYDDWTRARISTTGINSTTITTQKSNELTLIDVGSQKPERKRWIHPISENDIHFDIHVVSLAEFNQNLYENHEINRFDDSLKVWKELCHSKWLLNTRKILVFSKIDLFKQEFALGQFKQFVPKYQGDESNPDEAIEFLKQLFLTVATEKYPQHIDVVIGDLLNPQTAQNILDLIEKYIIPGSPQ